MLLNEDIPATDVGAVPPPCASTPSRPPRRRATGKLKMPKSWGSLPDSASYEKEVDWVYANYSRIVLEQPGKENKLVLHKAKTPAPSEGAITLAEWAAANRNDFQKVIVPKVKLGLGDGLEENVVRERKSIEDIKRILQRLLDDYEESKKKRKRKP